MPGFRTEYFTYYRRKCNMLNSAPIVGQPSCFLQEKFETIVHVSFIAKLYVFHKSEF